MCCIRTLLISAHDISPISKRVCMQLRAIVMHLFTTCLPHLLFLTTLDTSTLAVGFRQSYQTSGIDRIWKRMKSRRRWCGSPGEISPLTRKHRTEVSLTLSFQGHPRDTRVQKVHLFTAAFCTFRFSPVFS